MNKTTLNIRPYFMPGFSGAPWIEMCEARGWHVSDRAKYLCGVRPASYYFKEYNMYLPKDYIDYFREQGVGINIYFE